eukprot:scaffold122494_cov54-Cyclotella_meneghiniana.AAC.2
MGEWGNHFVALKCSAEEEDYPAANLVWGSVFFPCCAENNFWIILCKCEIVRRALQEMRRRSAPRKTGAET